MVLAFFLPVQALGRGRCDVYLVPVLVLEGEAGGVQKSEGQEQYSNLYCCSAACLMW